MKIVLFGRGFIDPASVIAETAKPKVLKNTIVITKDRAFVDKYRDRLDIIDYSGVAAEPGLTDAEAIADILAKIRPELTEKLGRAGDVLLAASCEAVEIAGLNLLQDICREKKFKFHGLFAAPFLFQGQKQAERMRSMLRSVADNYKSVSLYYSDEMLDLEQAASVTNQTMQTGGIADDSIYTMQNAYDALEREIADLVIELFGQIPKLDRGMQFTYDFRRGQFALAIEPLKLILAMWYKIVNDDELFGIHRQKPADYAARIEAAAAELNQGSDQESGRKSGTEILRGILNPEFREKKKDAYENIQKNSIPVTVFHEQTGDNKLDVLVGRIKDIIRGEDEEVDPEVEKRLENRLKGEIHKFQVRQAAAEAVFEGQQPTKVRDTAQAVASIYMTGEPPIIIEKPPEEKNVELRQTPYQRAQRMAKNKGASKSWMHIAEDLKAKGELPEDYDPGTGTRIAVKEHIPSPKSTSFDSEYFSGNKDEMGIFAGSHRKLHDVAMDMANDVAHAQAPPAPAPEAPAAQKPAPSQAEAAAPAPAEKTDIRPSAEDMVGHVTRDENPPAVDVRELAEAFARISQETDAMTGASMDFVYNEPDSIQKTIRQKELENRQKEQAKYKNERERRKAERQAAKISKKLAKAQEKASAAAARAEMAMNEMKQLSKENEEHEKVLESLKNE